MKTKLVYVLIILSIIEFAGCEHLRPSQTSETLYLQEIEVFGPINQPPVHLTDSSTIYSFTLTPRISYLPQTKVVGEIDGHSRVNQQGFLQVDTIYNNGTVTFKQVPDSNKYVYKGQNLSWELSKLYVALDADFCISKSFALFGGINYSLQNKLSIWGGRAGFGLFTSDGNSSLRLDAGLQVQEVAHNAQNVLLIKADPPYEERDNDVYFINDFDKSIHYNPFFSITYNSTNRDWLINFFLNAGYSLQTTVKFSSEDSESEDATGYIYRTNDVRGESISGFWNITPGFYFYFGDSARLLIGARFFFETINKTSNPHNFIISMAQFDFRL